MQRERSKANEVQGPLELVEMEASFISMTYFCLNEQNCYDIDGVARPMNLELNEVGLGQEGQNEEITGFNHETMRIPHGKRAGNIAQVI